MVNNKKIFKPDNYNILILVRGLNIGGAERQAIVNAKSLAGIGYKVEIACFYKPHKDSYSFDEENISLTILSSKKGSILRCFFNFIKIISLNKYDVIYSFTGVPNILAVFSKFFMRKKIIIWGKRATKLALNDYGIKYKVEVFLERLLSSWPDLIICNSQAAKNELPSDGFSTSTRLDVVHNGIDTKLFNPKKLLENSIEDLIFDLKKDFFTIGCVGRIDPMKGHSNVIEAFSYLLKIKSNFRLVIVGNDDKNLRDGLKKFASKLEINNKILWIDHCSNPENLYKQFDLITLASIYGEGFPNVLAEAMACGVPCVATDVGDSKIIVSKYGKTIPIKDPKALSDAWLNLVSNNSYLPQDLWKHIDINFSLDALQNKMNIILKELITNNE